MKESAELDLSKLSAEQLEAELKSRREAEKQKALAERNQFMKDKDDFGKHTISKFTQLHNELKELKDYTILKANELYDRMYEINGQEPKEVKSFSLKNEAGDVKITVDRQERFEFTEEATVHINAIKDIFKNKFADRNKGLYNVLDELLIKGNKGEYDPKLLAKARRAVKDLGDEKLIEQFDKLDDCQRVTGSSLYCRAYSKDEKGKWQDLSLQFSSL